MKSKKLKKKLISLLSIGLMCCSSALITLTSCSVFEPNTSPNIPPPVAPEHPPDLAEKIDYSTTETIKNAYMVAIDQIKPFYETNFNSSHKPNDPNNFGALDEYLYLNLGYDATQTKLGLMVKIWMKFETLYKNDDADYLFTLYLISNSLFMQIAWLYWLGLNYSTLYFYEWLNKNQTVDQDYKFMLDFLPVPQQTKPYIELINEAIFLRQNEKLFKLIWNKVYDNFKSQYRDNYFNLMDYYVNSIRYCLEKLKFFVEGKIPKSFIEKNPNYDGPILNFYDFFKNPLLKPEEQKEQDKKVVDNFNKGFELVKKSEKIWVDKLVKE